MPEEIVLSTQVSLTGHIWVGAMKPEEE